MVQPGENGWNLRVTDLFLHAVDVNAVMRRIDVNILLDQVDVNELLKRVDPQVLLDRIDMDALASQTDLGAVIARSSGGMASEALDAVRGQAVGLDRFIDRRVAWLLRRDRRTASPGPLARCPGSRPTPLIWRSVPACSPSSSPASPTRCRS